MAIQGHVFWGQWKGDKGLILYNNVGSFPKVPKTASKNPENRRS